MDCTSACVYGSIRLCLTCHYDANGRKPSKLKICLPIFIDIAQILVSYYAENRSDTINMDGTRPLQSHVDMLLEVVVDRCIAVLAPTLK